MFAVEHHAIIGIESVSVSRAKLNDQICAIDKT